MKFLSSIGMFCLGQAVLATGEIDSIQLKHSILNQFDGLITWKALTHCQNTTLNLQQKRCQHSRRSCSKVLQCAPPQAHVQAHLGSEMAPCAASFNVSSVHGVVEIERFLSIDICELSARVASLSDSLFPRPPSSLQAAIEAFAGRYNCSSP
jgi:hypothetical protein